MTAKAPLYVRRAALISLPSRVTDTPGGECTVAPGELLSAYEGSHKVPELSYEALGRPSPFTWFLTGCGGVSRRFSGLLQSSFSDQSLKLTRPDNVAKADEANKVDKGDNVNEQDTKLSPYVWRLDDGTGRLQVHGSDRKIVGKLANEAGFDAEGSISMYSKTSFALESPVTWRLTETDSAGRMWGHCVGFAEDGKEPLWRVHDGSERGKRVNLLTDQGNARWVVDMESDFDAVDQLPEVSGLRLLALKTQPPQQTNEETTESASQTEDRRVYVATFFWPPNSDWSDHSD